MLLWFGTVVQFLQIDKLEKVQLYSARIVTGLPILASKESLYF